MPPPQTKTKTKKTMKIPSTKLGAVFFLLFFVDEIYIYLLKMCGAEYGEKSNKYGITCETTQPKETINAN